MTNQRKPRGKILFDYVLEHASETPQAQLAIFDDQVITYQGMVPKVYEYAKALRASGVQQGDRIAHLGNPAPDFLVSYLATGLVGAAWMGLNPKYSKRELEHVLVDAQPNMIFISEHLTEEDLEGIQIAKEVSRAELVNFSGTSNSRMTSLDEFFARAADVSVENWPKIQERDAAIVVYTSGTTGAPKGALLPHQAICYSGEQEAGKMNDMEGTQNENVRVINNLPINHVGCLVDICSPIIVGGGCMVLMEDFDTGKMLKVIENEKITIIGGVPTMLMMMLADPYFTKCDMSSVKRIIWSGAAMGEPMLQLFKAMGMELDTGYGLTETIGGVTTSCPDDDVHTLASTIGKPWDPDLLRLQNKKGEIITKPGVHGEIQVQGISTMIEYINRPDATKENFTEDGWMHTGDIAEWTDNGYLKLVGRTKEMFKSGGYNVYPREIEAVLERFPGVALAAVIPAKDELFGEVGHAFIVPMFDLSVDKVKEWCKQELANYKVPKTFTISEELPILPIGKIDKKALAAQL